MFSAPVTAIRILPKSQICLAGTGPFVLVFDLKTNQQLLQEKILVNSVVHGFDFREMEDSSVIIVVFGQRTFSIVRWTAESPSTLDILRAQVYCSSWILSALIIQVDPSIESPTILFGTALNQLYRYQNSFDLIQSFKYTTLYSSCLFYHSNGKVIFAAGTVFGELILYEQDSPDHFIEKIYHSDHNGAIFGITYYENFLSTVGDDRTVKLYKFTDNLELQASFYAHEARIWQSSITSTHLLTCGEDSSIRLWSHKSTGELLRCFSVHRCKSVWSMDILRDKDNNQPLMIVSGWSDGGVRRYYLDDVPIDSQEMISLKTNNENDFPRNIVFFNGLNMIIHMNSGEILKYENNQTSLFFDGKDLFKNAYAKMSASEKYLAIGSLDGSIVIFDSDGTIQNRFQIDQNRNNKILQILWLNQTSSSQILVCIPDGIMFIYNIINEPATIEYCLEVLPNFEQRWPNTCLYYPQDDFLFIGDRQGNILSYDLKTCLIHQKFERLHGLNGTSFLDYDPETNFIRSCGRDGYINIFSFDSSTKQLTHQSTLTITSDIAWLDRLLSNPSLITCFTTNFFSLYTFDEQTKRRLMHVECGGGHRNHDFILTESLQAYFVYIRNKKVYLVEKNLQRILNQSTYLSINPPTHGTEIRCVKLFEIGQRMFFATGGEDTQLKIFSLKNEESNWKCEQISTLQSHLSAVCDLASIDNMIFSCGARAQIFAWLVKDPIIIRSGQFMLHPLRRRHGGGGGATINDGNKKENDDDHGLDVRFTSIAAMKENENYLLFVTGSDAMLRVFRYTISNSRFSLLQTCSHSDYCQLCVKVYSKRSIAFVSSTDGLLCAYDFSFVEKLSRSTTIRLHQSGINDLDCTEIESTNQLRLATVGDDGSVHTVQFDPENWLWKQEFSQNCIHQSPATGIRFLNSTKFLSIGIDQRLKFWSIDNERNCLELKKNFLVDIRDILSMDRIFFSRKNRFVILIAGAGVQTIEFDLTNSSFF